MLRKVLEVGWRSDPGIKKVRRGTRGYILGSPSPQLSLPRKLGSQETHTLPSLLGS